PTSTLFPYTTLFRSHRPGERFQGFVASGRPVELALQPLVQSGLWQEMGTIPGGDRGFLHQGPGRLRLAFAEEDLRLGQQRGHRRSEEHTSELQSRFD